MPYKRPLLGKPDKPHKLQETFGMYGFVDTTNDPGWFIPISSILWMMEIMP